jgi:hypothetical protein
VVLTGHYQKHEPANISSLAAERRTQMRRDVLKGLGLDDQFWNMLSPKMKAKGLTDKRLFKQRCMVRHDE